jgi:recombination protein RecT
MTRRSMTASFAPGAYVFPGGGVDALDAAAHAQASRRETQSDLHLTQAIAAIRESFEELGILLARREDGTMANANDIAALDRKAPFAPQCAARGLSLAADEVFVLAHWIGRPRPAAALRRALPGGPHARGPGARGRRDRAVRARVGAPADALARHEAGQFFIIFPTIRTLQRLAGLCQRGGRAAACAAPSSRCGPVARAPACWRARKRATWSTKRPLANWPWSAPTGRSCTRWTGRASSPRRCCATCSA